MNYEIVSDDRIVWINDSNGHCIARFGMFGVDIHKALTPVNNGPASDDDKHCLFCSFKRTGVKDWEIFKSKVREFFDLTVSDVYRPLWL